MCQSCENTPALLPRRKLLQLAGAAALGTFLARLAIADAPRRPPKPKNVLSPDAALERLIAGNRRYVRGATREHDFDSERAALTTGQNPFASILSCADSRVSPEFAFDEGRGDLFVVRLAGNFLDREGLASLEYSTAVLGVPLLVVLGHQSCGAVEAAVKLVKDHAKFPGHIGALAKAIAPAVKTAAKEPGDLLTNAIRENVVRNVRELRESSPIISKQVAEGRVKVVGGIYSLETGKVEFLA
jgi:carbonic anhydrase